MVQQRQVQLDLYLVLLLLLLVVVVVVDLLVTSVLHLGASSGCFHGAVAAVLQMVGAATPAVVLRNSTLCVHVTCMCAFTEQRCSRCL
jgi:hypothetical protein